MKRKIGRMLAWIGGITVGLIVLVIVIIVVAGGKEEVPDQTILRINFEQKVVEYVPDDPISKLTQKDALVVREIVAALEQASQDERVVGLLARVGRSRMGMGQIQEVRDAVTAFRERGKPAVAYAETFGEFGGGNGGYYLATSFDQIYLQPSGDIGLTGFGIEQPFLRGTLEKLGIEPRMGQRYEYKNAANIFMEKAYTDAHREADQTLLQGWYNQMVRGIAASLETSEDDVRALIDQGPILGTQAVDLHLVDSLAYRDEVYDKVKSDWGEDAEFLSLAEYIDRTEKPYDDGTEVALIYGVGAVTRGESEAGSMGSDTVTKAFRDAVKDEDVKAILFRVDSPGGSYVASDAIWRETVKAQKAGKPVIVSMGDVAGSGGYFVAMHADKIVAQPGTITGSIGVLAGKFLTQNFWDKIGLNWDEVHVGKNAMFWSSDQDFTPEQQAKFDGFLDRVYQDFTEKVAEGRNLPWEKVHEVAKGRIWTGEDALEQGLVDALGGFPVALNLVREALKLAPDAALKLKIFPKEKSLLELVMEKGLIGVDPGTMMMVRTMETLRPVLKLAQSLGFGQKAGVLTMPGGWGNR
ncbi:MAG: signal peptide peptidase SppA [bacterium]|nr:signal peptide peptidase SppA [bacterium]